MSYVEYSPALGGSGDALTAQTTMRRTVALVMPVKNEERSVSPTLDAVFASTRLPDEIIIADGQSVDQTLERVQAYMGRGVTIRVVLNPQIFGILVHPRWIEEMTKP